MIRSDVTISHVACRILSFFDIKPQKFRDFVISPLSRLTVHGREALRGGTELISSFAETDSQASITPGISPAFSAKTKTRPVRRSGADWTFDPAKEIRRHGAQRHASGQARIYAIILRYYTLCESGYPYKAVLLLAFFCLTNSIKIIADNIAAFCIVFP